MWSPAPPSAWCWARPPGGSCAASEATPLPPRSPPGMPVADRPLELDMTDPLAFAVTFDYRCPFARNAHEHVVAGLRAGAAWDVTFVPFSLGQVHVGEGEPDVWDHWRDDTGLLALQAGVVVRD